MKRNTRDTSRGRPHQAAVDDTPATCQRPAGRRRIANPARIFIAAVALVLGSGGVGEASAQPAGGNAPSAAERVIVKFSPALAREIEPDLSRDTLKLGPNVSSANVRALLARHGIRDVTPLHTDHVRRKLVSGAAAADLAQQVRQRFPARSARNASGVAPDLSRTYVLVVNGDTYAVAAGLRTEPGVEYAEPDGFVAVAMTPNDPYYSSSNSYGPFDDLWGLKKISSGTAWDTATGSGVVVAIVDSGIDYTHSDLAANVWTNSGEIAGNGIDDDSNGKIDDVRGWDFIGANHMSPAQDNDPADDLGHGTHVAGTVAAVGNNSTGVIGVAFGAKVMAVKGLAGSGYGDYSSLAACIQYAADNGADVVNNSWAGGYTQVVEDALSYAASLGVVIVSAAANSNLDVANFHPASSTHSMAISAYDYQDQKASFSNWGTKIDVAAPGVAILSTTMGGGYAWWDGTSMASPHVAGLAALLIQHRPTYSRQQIVNAIRVSADDVGTSGPDIYSGRGRINAPAALSALPWTSGDVGAVAAAGYYSESGGVVTVHGSGADIWGTADEFHYVHQQINGDVTVVARVTAVGNTDPWAKAGIMIRDSLNTSSPHVMMMVGWNNNSGMLVRATSGGSTTLTGGAWSWLPTWVKVVRSGNTFSGYQSQDGSTWSLVATTTVAMSTTAYVGLAVTSHNDGTICTATIDNVSLVTTAPWVSGDIGAVAAAGSYSESGGVFTVNGSGADIWNTSDEFHFVRKQKSGDGTIIARVTGVTNTDPWAKAGIMIRESLNANSQHVMMMVGWNNNSGLLVRSTSGASTTLTGGAWSWLPTWVKIVRVGNTFTGYQSQDGSTWSQVGSVTVSMSSSVHIGLAVTSHNDGTICTGTIDNLSMTWP